MEGTIEAGRLCAVPVAHGLFDAVAAHGERIAWIGHAGFIERDARGARRDAPVPVRATALLRARDRWSSGQIMDLAWSDARLYVAARPRGIEVCEPERRPPCRLWCPLPATPLSIRFEDGVVFAALGERGVVAVLVAANGEAEAPRDHETPERALDVAVDGDALIVADGGAVLRLPRSPARSRGPE